MSEKPISPEKLAANRANAARSTGPRTPEGKAASSQNARKHRFAPDDIIVPTFEDDDDYFNLRADLAQYYKPVSIPELRAVERMAAAELSMIRLSRLESGLFTACLNRAGGEVGEPLHLLRRPFSPAGTLNMVRTQKCNYYLAEGFHGIAGAGQTWKNLLRHQAQAERFYRRAVEDFERLKAQRLTDGSCEPLPVVLTRPPLQPEPDPPTEPPAPGQPAPEPSAAESSTPETPAAEPVPAARARCAPAKTEIAKRTHPLPQPAPPKPLPFQRRTQNEPKTEATDHRPIRRFSSDRRPSASIVGLMPSPVASLHSPRPTPENRTSPSCSPPRHELPCS